MAALDQAPTNPADGADRATRSSTPAAAGDPACAEARAALDQNRLADAEQLLRARLNDFPTEVVTVRTMAELAIRLRRLAEAEELLRRALEIAPYFHAARALLIQNLRRMNRPVEALAEVETMLTEGPDDPPAQVLKASLLMRTGDLQAARLVYERLLAKQPSDGQAWLSLGQVLKTLGRQKEAIAACRQAIELFPTWGRAWWDLSNLKTFRFSPEDIAAMEAALRQTREDENLLYLHFALGKAREDENQHEAAFGHWVEGNAVRRRSLRYDADENHAAVVRAKRFFDTSVLTPKRGCLANDPIFVVGMPRSGSTLVEQILASHSQIEGTMELPDMMDIAARLSSAAERAGQPYPDALAGLTDAQLRELGEEYIERTRVHRRTDRPHFIDKMPNNWAHVGLIRMILPNARIVDVRRHPVGCCLSMWKQHFVQGQGFSYDFGDLARYYCDYAALMEHFDEAMPGSVHRVIYERMVADSGTEIRSLLEHLGLPFEESCMTFWRNDRAVRTPSSEQVRQPIFTDAVDHWRRFEPWLGPLIAGLEPAIKSYPSVAANRRAARSEQHGETS